jgi:hypothetical protein
VLLLLLLQVLNMAVNSWLKSVLGEWRGTEALGSKQSCTLNNLLMNILCMPHVAIIQASSEQY